MSLFYSISKIILRALFKLVYGHKIYLPEGGIYAGAAIIAANHTSFLDPPIAAISWPLPIHFLARKTLFDGKILRTLITTLNAHPLNGANDTSSLKQVLAILAEGKQILLFPEGTRSIDGNLLPFKQGVGMLARKSGVPIIPVYIEGTYKAWPKNKKYPTLFKAKTACAFGKPIFLSEFDEQDPKALGLKITARLERELLQLKNQIICSRSSVDRADAS